MKRGKVTQEREVLCHQGEQLKEVRWGTNYKYTQELWKQVLRKQYKIQSNLSTFWSIHESVNPARLTCPAQWLFLPLHQYPFTSSGVPEGACFFTNTIPFSSPVVSVNWILPTMRFTRTINSCSKLVMLTHQAGIQEGFTTSTLIYNALISALNIYQLFSFRKLYALKGWSAGYLLF